MKTTLNPDKQAIAQLFFVSRVTLRFAAGIVLFMNDTLFSENWVVYRETRKGAWPLYYVAKGQKHTTNRMMRNRRLDPSLYIVSEHTELPEEWLNSKDVRIVDNSTVLV